MNAKVLSPATSEKIRLAWYGPHSAAVIARTYRLGSWQAVRAFWKAEQDAFRLPQGDRPSKGTNPGDWLGFEKPIETAPRRWPIVASDLDDAPADDEDDLSDEQFTARIPDRDPLLIRLQAKHGSEPWRAHDDLPRETLRIERDPHFEPSPFRCIEFQKARDAYVMAQRAAQRTEKHA